MTPLQINIMIHHYITTEPYSHHNIAHASSRAVHDQREALVESGMLSYYNGGYSVTEKGKFYIDYLLSVPVPSTKFVIEFPLPF